MPVKLILRKLTMLVRLVSLLLCLSSSALGQKFSLSDLQWTLKSSNESIVVPGRVPSQAHLDLLNAGVITEPLLGANGELLQFNFKSQCSLTEQYRLHPEMGRQRKLDLHSRCDAVHR